MKNKTKKIIKITCAILLVVLVQITGVTYAKYLTSDKGVGSAEVAKWSFKLDKGGQEIKTVNLAESLDYNTLVDGKIAPGTSGIISIIVDATGSEVDVDYDVKFTNEQNKPNNIKYFYGGEYYNSLSEITTIKGTIPYDSEKKKIELFVMWNWNYETGTTDSEKAENDKLDTQDANTITEYTFDIVATGTQGR